MPRAASLPGFLVLLTLCMASPAAAIHAPILVAQWGSLGTGDGQFELPVGVAFDPAGYVYVCDGLTSAIQKFTPDGGFLVRWEADLSNGLAALPQGIAADPAGDIYVTDPYAHVQKFRGTGEFVLRWGGAGTAANQFENP